MMNSIRITAPPPGFAPEQIRQMWVGVEIPLATEEELQENPIAEGYSYGTGENIGGYIVTMSSAVAALREAGKEEAASFWEKIPFGAYLEFKKCVCQLV